MRSRAPNSATSSAWLARRSVSSERCRSAGAARVSVPASTTVRAEYSRMRRSRAARDSATASFRPCFTSTVNQLSIPWLMNCSEDR